MSGTRWTKLPESLRPEQRQAMEFLRDHLPESDLDCYPMELFLRFADHALALREEAPWCEALDWEIFAHYVLFPRVNDEDLSFHRKIFCDALWPRVRNLSTMEERVLEVNRWCHEHASYQPQDERTASPLTVYRCGSGRCGEESVFLVSALRSVGIAARQVYAPRWSHCDDNHAWVEALCGNTWRFLGACEPEPVLDRGWFTAAASRAMLVHSRIFGEGTSPLHGEPLGREGVVRWFNQTARYAEADVYAFQALADGKPAAGAAFQLQILNEASFHTIAVLTAGEEGRAQARLGRGSLHVLASLGALSAEGDCVGSGITLCLTPPEPDTAPWTEFDFRTPAGGRPAPAVLSAEQKNERAEVRRQGDAQRQERLARFLPPEMPGRDDLLQAARGNRGQIQAFLSQDGPPGRERLVRTLASKDLRDISREILEDHFTRLPPRPDRLPEDVYWRYVACPRIALEKAGAWRGPLSGWLADWADSPAALWLRLEETLTDVRENVYGNLFWNLERIPAAGRCDEKSRRALLIAALRTLGIPARLRPMDGAPEIWQEGAFRTIRAEDTGRLLLTCSGDRKPRYRQDWTLSRRTAGGWQLMALEEEVWQDGTLRLALPAGRYRLITSVRLPHGDQLAARREVTVEPDRERRETLRFRSCRLEDLLGRQALPALSACTPEGQRIPNLFHASDGRPLLAVWLEEGGEPTEHLLHELLARRQTLEALPLQVLFLVRGQDSTRQPTLAHVMAQWRSAQVLLDDWAYDLETVARCLGRDPDSPPLAVLCDGAGQAVYSDSGYRVGSAELLVRIAGYLCKSR